MADITVGSVRNGQIEHALPADRGTYTASATVTGGQLVEATTGDRQAQPAGTGSLLVYGVALYNAAVGQTFTVASVGVWELIAHGAITAGSRVIAYAGGLVQDAGATPDARKVIGYVLNDAVDGGVAVVRLSGTLG